MNEHDKAIDPATSRALLERRDMLALPLAGMLPAGLLPAGLLMARAEAAPNPAMTITVPPQEIVWTALQEFPKQSVETAALWSKVSEPGLYYTLIKWYPGYMSAPHWYETDRYCVVVSGVWWVNSGETFEPEGTVPMPAGSFIRRVARTPHYDGVKADGTEPAVIAICGMGPINFHAVDPNQPGWRKV